MPDEHVEIQRYAFTGPIQRGWSAFQRRNAATCECGHPLWAHKWLDEPACSWTGSCPCEAFTR